MAKPTNQKLYDEVKAEADQKYKRHSLYKSGWITKTYQSRGGKYKGRKSDKVGQWFQEDWVEVKPYLEGNKIKCGATKGKGKACRPLKRINKNTPITLPELLKLHDRTAILKVVSQKQKDMNKRITWKTLKIS